MLMIHECYSSGETLEASSGFNPAIAGLILGTNLSRTRPISRRGHHHLVFLRRSHVGNGRVGAERATNRLHILLYEYILERIQMLQRTHVAIYISLCDK